VKRTLATAAAAVTMVGLMTVGSTAEAKPEPGKAGLKTSKAAPRSAWPKGKIRLFGRKTTGKAHRPKGMRAMGAGDCNAVPKGWDHLNSGMCLGDRTWIIGTLAQHLGNSRYQYYMLQMQGDGNLVVYQVSYDYSSEWGSSNWQYNAMFASNTQGIGPHAYTVMQPDGNLVLYDSSNRARWSTGTHACQGQGVWARIQLDGNLVLYRGNPWEAVWAIKSYDNWRSPCLPSHLDPIIP